MENFKVLELFSGIGGMHYALKESKALAQIVAAVDINENANATYKHNFPESKCLNNNIQKLTIKDFKDVNAILMSPPCQPFSRNGNFRDIEDRRSDAFQSVCEIIKGQQLPNLSHILMENVMGFEKSQMRTVYIDCLKEAGFHYQEFIISPSQVGVANTRHRYYCIARKTEEFSFKNEEILTSLPSKVDPPTTPPMSSYIESNLANPSDFNLTTDTLTKRFQVLDIATRDSTNSMCFTKSYSRYIEGTGSVYSPLTRVELNENISELEQIEDNLELKKNLKLRFFTPREVSRLMSFPEDFGFPESVSLKQQYKLLGNSINVKVVGELVKLLFEG